MAEQPFTFSVSDEDLKLLRDKLTLARFPDELDEAAWDYGAPLSDVKRLAARWKDGWDWHATADKINAFPQFTRDVEVEGHGTLNIHYLHQKSQQENAIPLLFIHGWPGHFMESSKLVPLLTTVSPDQPSFHVVAPSLPGFGFSEAPKKKGFSIPQYAEACHKVMLALGYKEYVLQGGDWGYVISRSIAHQYPQHAKARHNNFYNGYQPTLLSNPVIWLQHLVTPYTEREKAGVKLWEAFSARQRGYYFVQATQPQTIAYSLTDSPVGLLAWLYEKLVIWTDNYPWTDDEVLSWVSIYWFSRAGPGAAGRIYYEANASGDNIRPLWSAVPQGFSFFPKELRQYPRAWVRTTGNVVFESEPEKGGHFAAHEQPELLAGDLRKMFGKGGPAFGVVTGKNGYGDA